MSVCLQALLKISSAYLNKKIPNIPDMKVDGAEERWYVLTTYITSMPLYCISTTATHPCTPRQCAAKCEFQIMILQCYRCISTYMALIHHGIATFIFMHETYINLYATAVLFLKVTLLNSVNFDFDPFDIFYGNTT